MVQSCSVLLWCRFSTCTCFSVQVGNLAAIHELVPVTLYTDSRLVGPASGESVMADLDIRRCQCPKCVTGTDRATVEVHHQMNLLFSRLDEQQRRWFAALEAKKVGHGGDTLVSLIVGLHVDTI